MEGIDKFYQKPGNAIMISGCIDTQKAHLIEALGEKFKFRVIITGDEAKARQLRED